jgi:hypothetical protein
MSKIAEIKKQHETLILQMQFFCLDPKYEIYQKICNSKLSTEPYFLFWKTAVLATYGPRWLEDKTIDILDDNITEVYKTMRETLIKQISKRPTSTKIDNLWYLYFASGESNLLLHAFKAGGNTDINIELRNTIIDMYVEFIIEYRRKIAEIKQNCGYISGHEIGMEQLNKTINGFNIITSLIEKQQDIVDNMGEKEKTKLDEML